MKRWYSEVGFFTFSSQEAKICSSNPSPVTCVCSWLSLSRPDLLWPLVLPLLRPALNRSLSFLGFTCWVQAKRRKMKKQLQKIIRITYFNFWSRRKVQILIYKMILLFKIVFQINVIVWNTTAIAILSGGTPVWVGVGTPSSGFSHGHHRGQNLFGGWINSAAKGPFEMQGFVCQKSVTDIFGCFLRTRCVLQGIMWCVEV